MAIESSEEMDALFPFEDLQSILADLKDTSTSEDGVLYSFIKKLNYKTMIYLLDLINNIFQPGNIPYVWKSQIIIPAKNMKKALIL